MPFPQEPDEHGNPTFPLFSCLLRQLRAWMLFGVIALAWTATAFGQEPSKPPSQTTSAQTPAAPSNLPGVALYNLLQAKSIVFPDIAASTERLSPGQKFE